MAPGAPLMFAADPSPLRVGAQGRSLVDAGGRAVFLLADTAWSLVLRASREDAEFYLRKRKEQGFNAVTFVLFAPGKNELNDRAENFYGDVPFAIRDGRVDPTQPIERPGRDAGDAAQYDYWDHVDHVVATARRIGLYTILLPTWGTGVAGSYDGKDAKEIVFDADNARSYGAWLARRYGAEPHVLWMMGGDRSAVAGEKDYRPVFRALAEKLAAGAPAQLISYHPRKGAPQSAEWFHGDAWLAFNSIQEWPDRQRPHIAADWARTPVKPTWLFEGRYEGYWRGNYKAEDWGEWQVRQQAWQTVCAGAFGHTYGHERVFGFGFDRADWKAALEAPGARSVGHLARLMGRLSSDEFLGREPAPYLIDGDAGKAERLKSTAVVALRTGTPAKAFFYSANGRAVRVKTAQLAAGSLYAFWFDPRAGTWWRGAGAPAEAEPRWFARDIASGPGAAVRTFQPPTRGEGHDWVLVLAATAEL